MIASSLPTPDLDVLPAPSVLDLLAAHPGNGTTREAVVFAIAVRMFLRRDDIDRMLARAAAAVTS